MTAPRALAAALALVAGVAAAQPSPTADTVSVRYQAYDAGGEAHPLDVLLDEAAEADVVFLGEVHDDPTAQALELAALAGLVERAGGRRPVVLALEMFEADVQPVLDEYVSGLIPERSFLEAARPWGNYADYRPLVEFAKAHGVAVVASNAPVRYVRLVSSGGDLSGLSPAALGWLPPLPVAAPSDSMAASFARATSGMMGHGGPSPEGLLAAQNLRDASMAQAVARALARPDRPLVVHVNGGFHSAGGRGIPEHLARVAPGARRFLIAVEPEADIDVRPVPS
ncbi:MAG TPA: ChaN family lipoprotein, partial [Rubricoccaceae bacterium]